MPEQKKTLKILGTDMLVADVPITKAIESFNEYVLEDGSVLRVKCVATSIVRIEGQYNQEGRPVYIVYTSPNVYVEQSALTGPAPAQSEQKKAN